jgi:hypothetical protein
MDLLTRNEAELIRAVLLSSEKGVEEAELQASKLGVDLKKLLEKLDSIVIRKD